MNYVKLAGVPHLKESNTPFRQDSIALGYMTLLRKYLFLVYEYGEKIPLFFIGEYS